MRGTLAVAAFAFAAVLASAARADDPNAAGDLARAKSLLATKDEATIREGAELCLRLDSAASMELVMALLEGENPHRRDIAWEVIPKFKDAYARQVVASRMKTGGKDARLREWCAMALGEFGVADFVGPLKAALASSDDVLRAAAASALGRIKDKSAFAALRERLRDDDPFARAESIEAASRVSPAESRDTMWAGLRDADAGVRCALLGAVPAIYPDLAEDASAEALKDSDWRPRLQAVENLIAAHTKAAVGWIVHSSGDPRPVIARRMNAYLQSISGMKFTEREQWQAWWRENRETFVFPDSAAGGAAPADDKGKTFAAFNGLEVTSDHVVFVIDKSADMLRPLKNGKIRDAAASAELEATLTNLPAGVTFNVVTYGAKTQSAWKKPVVLDAKTRAAALKFVAGVPCEGRKDIWDVLSSVVADGTIDTAYLLSSGEPEIGLYVHWNRVTEHLKILNRHYKVVFHGVSYASLKWYQDQIEKIAESTGGKFVARE